MSNSATQLALTLACTLPWRVNTVSGENFLFTYIPLCHVPGWIYSPFPGGIRNPTMFSGLYGLKRKATNINQIGQISR